jgi:hypothetical protein
MTSPIQATAVHEAGHAIVATHFGIRFEGVELRVEAIDGYWHCGGRIRGAELPENADNRRLQMQLTVIMAGYGAQSLLAPTNGFSLSEFKFPDDRDFAAAIDVLRSMQPPVTDPRDAEAAMNHAWLDARQLVAANWHRLTAIADELVGRSHRNGQTIACHILLTSKELSRLFSDVAG